MTTNTKKGPIIDPGLCRCCGATKKCRLLNVEYVWLGQKEMYSEMFVDTFGLLLSHLDGEPTERGVCATCVTRLRDASAFRKQVLSCEEKLLQARILIGTDIDPPTEIKQEIDCTVTKEEISNAVEKNQINNGDDDDLVRDEDHCMNEDDAETQVLIKNEPIKNQVTQKKVKSMKKEKKSKVKKKGRKKDSREERRAKQEMLERMRLMEEKLELLEQLDEMESPPMKPQKPRVETDHKAFENTVTIVENSYVCPFDTSFSDYYCLYCRQVYTDPNKLREHTLSHDPVNFKEAIINKKMPQLDVTRVDCRLCPEQIGDIKTLKEHLTVHGKVIHEVSDEFLQFKLTSNNLKCIECDSVFSFFHALKKHSAEHFGTCICDICGAHYFEERMLLLHQKSHQKVEEIFQCKDCGKSFKSKHSRNLHEARTHRKEPAYQCTKCDAVLFTYTLRYRHMIEVHGEERLFSCDHCDRAYDSRKSLREHNRRFHLKIFKHQCDLCDKRFYLPSRLREHMATHTGERNFRCEYCGKSYPRLRGLKVHMQSHSSEKKYRCVLCNASFTQNVNLKNHVKRQHQNLDVEEGFHEYSSD